VPPIPPYRLFLSLLYSFFNALALGVWNTIIDMDDPGAYDCLIVLFSAGIPPAAGPAGTGPVKNNIKDERDRI
jgi:hypothetical protein